MTREEAINLIADMDSDKYTAKEAVAGQTSAIYKMRGA